LIWLTILATLAMLCAFASNCRPSLSITMVSLLGALLGMIAAIGVSAIP